MQNRFFPAKLLLTFVNEGGGRMIVDASRRGGARGGTKFAARKPGDGAGNAARDEYCAQDAVITLMWDEAERVVASILESVAAHPEHIDGSAVILDVRGALTRPGFSFDTLPDTRGETMGSDSMMIVSITNHGEAEALMGVARAAGARGGTIINAKGTGTEDDLQYFGISLVPEKEILIIISDAASSGVILKELGDQPLFNEPGGGIIFSVAVERFIPLKNRSESNGL